MHKPATEELSADKATDDGRGPRRCLNGDSGRKAVAVAGTDADAGSGCFFESCGRTRSVNDISFCAACVDSAPGGQTCRQSQASSIASETATRQHFHMAASHQLTVMSSGMSSYNGQAFTDASPMM